MQHVLQCVHADAQLRFRLGLWPVAHRPLQDLPGAVGLNPVVASLDWQEQDALLVPKEGQYARSEDCAVVAGSVNVWRYCTNIFDYLALAAIIDDKILCMHGEIQMEATVTYIFYWRTCFSVRTLSDG